MFDNEQEVENRECILNFQKAGDPTNWVGKERYLSELIKEGWLAVLNQMKPLGQLIPEVPTLIERIKKLEPCHQVVLRHDIHDGGWNQDRDLHGYECHQR